MNNAPPESPFNGRRPLVDELPAEDAFAADAGEQWPEPDGEPASGAAVLDDWIVFPVIVLGVLVATGFPLFLQQELCLPVLNTLVIFPLFVWAVRSGRMRRAIVITLFWAFCLALTMVGLTLLMNEQAAGAVQGLAEYRTQFIRWIADGVPVEILPAQGWLAQLRELAIFAVAAALTAGLGGLFLLTLAIDIVSANAASLALEALRPLPVLLLSWPLWNIARLVGAVLITAALAEPLATGQLRGAQLAGWFRRRRRLLAWGLLAWVAGALLHATLAPLYRAALEAGLGLR